MKAKYVNPFTDFGFKKIFGEEASKPALLDFLNALLPDAHIKNLNFKNTEQLPETSESRRAIFDIYCENEKGEKFIVELQKARQNFFKERTIYYSTFPIRELVEKGDWNFDLKAVFCIGILDFTFRDYETEEERHEWLHEIKLKNKDGKTFYDKLTYLYLEMPNFTKNEGELTTQLDKWLYFIKHLEDFQSIPEIFKDEVVFVQAMHKAELSALTLAEYTRYEDSFKIYRDWANIIETAKSDTEKRVRNEVRSEVMIEMAKTLKANGVSNDVITKSTGLSAAEIELL